MADESTNETTKPVAEPVKSDFEKAYERGYLGEKVDPEPNHTYTVAGVIQGASKS